MADEHDRDQESLGTEDTRYKRELDAEQQRRHELAERLKDAPIREPGEE